MSTGQGVPGPAERIESGAARDEDGRAIMKLVRDPLEQVLPFWRLVQLIEHEQRGILRPGHLSNDAAIHRDVPIEISAAIIQQRAGEGRLAALARPREENHLPWQIPVQCGGQIAHSTILKPILFWSSPKEIWL